MTGGVEQALARIILPKDGADRQPTRRGEPEPGFDQAMKIIQKPKPTPQANEPVDNHRQWSRFGNKLDATINVTPGLVSKFNLPSLDRESITQPEDAAVSKGSPGFEDPDETPKLDMPARSEGDGPQIDGIAQGPVPPQMTDRLSRGNSGDENGSEAAPEAMEEQASRTVVASKQGPLTQDPVELDGSNQGAAAAAQRFDRETGRRIEKSVPSSRSSDAGLAQSAAGTSVPPVGIRTVPENQQPAVPSMDAAKVSDGDRIEEPAVTSIRTSGEDPRTMPKVTIVAEQTIPSPPQSTLTALTSSLASGGLLKLASAGHDTDRISLPVSASATQSFSIQLHPSELGMVTASLKFAREQLTIEIQVENAEAYRALSKDSESLVKALRGLGYEIDRVTVLQPMPAASNHARPDASPNMPAQSGRSGDQTGTGASGNGDAGSGGREHDAHGGNSGSSHHTGLPGNNDRRDDGVYI